MWGGGGVLNSLEGRNDFVWKSGRRWSLLSWAGTRLEEAPAVKAPRANKGESYCRFFTYLILTKHSERAPWWEGCCDVGVFPGKFERLYLLFTKPCWLRLIQFRCFENHKSLFRMILSTISTQVLISETDQKQSNVFYVVLSLFSHFLRFTLNTLCALYNRYIAR